MKHTYYQRLYFRPASRGVAPTGVYNPVLGWSSTDKPQLLLLHPDRPGQDVP